MIIFHEGMPRSGKSYEAVVYYILEALKNKRPVDAYVKGLDHAKLAELAGITEEECRELLNIIDKEQVPEIYSHVRKNSLVVLDELQNFWPNGRQKLPEPVQLFITEHGHDGHDILAMGQDMRDCHAVWRRRVSQKTFFLKMEAIGQANRYQWTTYKAVRPEKFEKVNSGIRSYEEKYFGSYASHNDGTTNKGQFQDDRANVLKRKSLLVAPLAVVLMIASAIWMSTSFFAEDGAMVNSVAKHQQQPQRSDFDALEAEFNKPTGSSIPTAVASKPQQPEIQWTGTPVDYLNKVASQNRLRLAAMVQHDGRLFAVVQVIDKTNHMVEEFRADELTAMGWHLEPTSYGLIAKADTTEHLIRAWPFDPVGQVNRRTRESL